MTGALDEARTSNSATCGGYDRRRARLVDPGAQPVKNCRKTMPGKWRRMFVARGEELALFCDGGHAPAFAGDRWMSVIGKPYDASRKG